MVLAATARSLLLFLALCNKPIEGWATDRIVGLGRSTAPHKELERRRQSRTPRRLLGRSSATTLPQQGGGGGQERPSISSQSETAVWIRESLHGDLGKCAEVVMSAFYPNYKNPFKHMVRLAELSRLQQSFSYDKTQHVMYVAEVVVVDESNDNNNNSNNMIVGFCDIDLRPPNRPMPYSYNPRPYLSDLCVHADHRRRGIGRELVLRCEEFCVKAGKDRVYIRVEDNNAAALDLYARLGYVAVDNPDAFKDAGSILLLAKDLRASRQALVGNTAIQEDQERSGDFYI
jgi:ribosomal protein S18 acetylase RimI-like enzyme